MISKNGLRKILFFLAISAISISARSQEEQKVCPKMLLSDLSIQIESSEAVNQMYNFKFDKAEKKYHELRKRYPTHPMPYFLLGLSEWWKMLPNTDDHRYDEAFMAYMDTCIQYGEKLYEENKNNLEASFFLACAYGLKGEYYGTNKSYTKAAWATKNALSHLSETSDKAELSPEFLYGDAILNYYKPFLKEEYPLLYPILVLFPSGDKELGIKQLKDVTYNAFYARTEAQYQLLRIYDNEDEYHKGYPIASYLASTFPDNAYFLRQYAKFSWFDNKHDEARKVCYDIINKYEKKYPGFEETSARYAGYILGDIFRKTNKIDSASKYYDLAVKYSEKAGQTSQGYYLYSLEALGDMADEKGDYKTAEAYYRKLGKNGWKKRRRYGIVKESKSKAKEMSRKLSSDQAIF
jgi:hypothetical protein